MIGPAAVDRTGHATPIAAIGRKVEAKSETA